MAKPLAVIISDVHFSVQTLEKASQAFLQAQFKAAFLKIPLIVAGDIHDSKAQMRAEVVNRMIELFSVKDAPKTIVLVGNHDMVNEREANTFKHALNFLKPYATVIESPTPGRVGDKRVLLIPYQSDIQKLKDIITAYYDADEEFDKPDLIIMHQGIIGAGSGEYFQDHTAIPIEYLSGLRVISGHYHTRQALKLGATGQFDYIGNPFTMNFAEATDPEKGYQILYDDLSLEFVPTNLPAHRTCKVDFTRKGFDFVRPQLKAGDILKVTLSGPSDELAKVTKAQVQEMVNFSNIILDLEPREVEASAPEQQLTQSEMFDSIIDSTVESEARKERLKLLWRTLA